MVLKVIYNITNSYNLVSTLLIFGVYPHIVTHFSPSASHQKLVNIMAKAISKLLKLKAQQRVKDAFNSENSLETIETLLLALSLGNKV